MFSSFSLTSKIVTGKLSGGDTYMIKRDTNQFNLEFLNDDCSGFF